MGKITHRGGCHCGAVRFEVKAAAAPRVLRCNCSMCRLSGFEHLIVAAADFHLLQGRASLTAYTFNTGVARHLFCSHCGIKSFYVPRSNPDGYSVNLRCLDPGTITSVHYEDFDGAHWERHGAELAALTRTGS